MCKNDVVSPTLNLFWYVLTKQPVREMAIWYFQ